MDRKKEYILCAALHYDDGKEYVHQPKNIKTGFVICGRRHHNCYALIVNMVGIGSAVKKDINIGRDGQGFITSMDRYVGRKEAMKIAKAAKQLLNPGLHSDNEDAILISEDLY